MDLITPDFGLLFWTGLVFCLLMFLLAKFAWKPILNAVNVREQKIQESLELAEKTKAEMLLLHSENERILKEAKAERDSILKDAKEAGNKMIDEAREKAKTEGTKLIESAKAAIQSERNAAISDMKAQIASFSVEIAEIIVKESLSTDSKQKELASKMVDNIKLN